MDRSGFNGRWIAVPLLSATIGLCSAFAAHAQTPEPTVESAQAFLADVLTKGTSGVIVLYTSNGEPTGDRVWASVSSVSGSGCSTFFNLSSKWGNGSRTIDWTHVSQVVDTYSMADGEGKQSVWVAGAIRDSAGDTVPEAYFGVESSALSRRVKAAMQFLRDKCDSSSKYGF